MSKSSLILLGIQLDLISTHFQRVNLEIWQPGRDMTVDESIVRFTGRAVEITTVSNKPTPTIRNPESLPSTCRLGKLASRHFPPIRYFRLDKTHSLTNINYY